jgi:predicted transposase/invertase (TIGR01784 family)
MASQVLVNISRDEHERARLLSEYKYIVDTQSKVVQAERDGIREGARNMQLKAAKNLKTMGAPLEQIAVAAGLPVDEIIKL